MTTETTLEILPYEITPEIKEIQKMVAEVQQSVIDQMKIPEWMFREDMRHQLWERQCAIRRAIHEQTAPFIKILGDLISLQPTKFIAREDVEAN